MKNLILVTGTQRSGVSVIGGALWACGARGGRITVSKMGDGRGAFENSEIRDCVVRPFLDGIGADVRGQYPLPDLAELEKLPETKPELLDAWQRLVTRIFEEQSPSAESVFYCSTLSALLYPVWLRTFPDAKWLLVRRRREEILNSCLQTAWMNGYPDAAGWSGWIDHYERCFDAIAARAASVSIWPHAVMGKEQGMAELKNAAESLGLEWNGERVYDLVAPSLWWKKGKSRK